jgi:hypothetical protein
MHYGAPTEPVWKNVKHDRIGKTGVTSKQDLKSKAIGALRRLQKRPGLVRAFFADPHLALHHSINRISRPTYARLSKLIMKVSPALNQVKLHSGVST